MKNIIYKVCLMILCFMPCFAMANGPGSAPKHYWKDRPFIIKNNLKATITVNVSKESCYEKESGDNGGWQIASNRTATFNRKEDEQCSSGYINFVINYIYRGKSYQYNYKWSFKRTSVSNKNGYYTYDKKLWYDLTDNSNNDPSVNQVMYITSATCNYVSCISSNNAYTETYEDHFWSSFWKNHWSFGDPMYQSSIVVDYNNAADTATIIPNSINLGDMTITDGYGKTLATYSQNPPQGQKPDAFTFKYHKSYEIHFSKTNAFCSAQWGKVSCPSSINRIEVTDRDGDSELAFVCSETAKGDSECPWTSDENNPNPSPHIDIL
ncbi:hypothetical protein L3V83_08940 [Thiotrichales bacterium 19X7-9]|nr:hypothetical protein [Thiotrichales bacterium 19X7-9]